MAKAYKGAWADQSEEAKQRSRDSVQRVKQAKQRYISDLKTLEGCRDCGEDDPVVLDLHHRDPQDKHPRLNTTARGFPELSWPDLRAELEKCDVLCANCHRRHHHKD